MSETSWRTPTVVIAFGALILALSLGIRHGFGLFLQPMSADTGWGREVFALAIASQNLIWGLAQPITGMLADRWGAGRIILAGTVLYGGGLVAMALAGSQAGLVLGGGVLIGLGLSGTSFAVVLGAIGRAVPAERRSTAFGIAAAAGSFGQFAMVPGTATLITTTGWSMALLLLAGLSLAMAPLALAFAAPSASAQAGSHPGPTAGRALREALRHPGFWLLSFGFFVCGFQVVFIGNVAGTYFAGRWGERVAKPRLLSAIYFGRAIVIALFAFLPVSAWSAYAFGIAMGLLWLSTVPLTHGTVAAMFGVRNLSMLTGLVFLFHQVGAFLGGWLGGYAYDRTGSYDAVWLLAIGLSLVAALLNLPVRETPVLRPAWAASPP